MTILYFTHEDFNDGLIREFVGLGFDSINSKSELRYEGVGSFDLGFILNGRAIGDLKFDYDVSNREIFVNSVNVFGEHQGNGFGGNISRGLEYVSREFYFNKVKLIPRDKTARSFWEHMGYSPSFGTVHKNL